MKTLNQYLEEFDNHYLDGDFNDPSKKVLMPTKIRAFLSQMYRELNQEAQIFIDRAESHGEDRAKIAYRKGVAQGKENKKKLDLRSSDTPSAPNHSYIDEEIDPESWKINCPVHGEKPLVNISKTSSGCKECFKDYQFNTK